MFITRSYEQHLSKCKYVGNRRTHFWNYLWWWSFLSLNIYLFLKLIEPVIKYQLWKNWHWLTKGRSCAMEIYKILWSCIKTKICEASFFLYNLDDFIKTCMNLREIWYIYCFRSAKKIDDLKKKITDFLNTMLIE